MILFTFAYVLGAVCYAAELRRLIMIFIKILFSPSVLIEFLRLIKSPKVKYRSTSSLL